MKDMGMEKIIFAYENSIVPWDNPLEYISDKVENSFDDAVHEFGEINTLFLYKSELFKVPHFDQDTNYRKEYFD